MSRNPETRPQISEEEKWISIADLRSIVESTRLQELINGLSPKDREEIMDRIKMNTMTNLLTQQEAVGQVDALLGEVARKVFGKPVSDLPPTDLLEIRHIRKEFGIEGEFNPTA